MLTSRSQRFPPATGSPTGADGPARFMRRAGAGRPFVSIDCRGPIGRCDAAGNGIFPYEIENALAAAPSGTPIRLRINSPGGDYAMSRRIAATLREAAENTHISVHVSDECSSGALFILLAADWRSAAPGARFHVHAPATAALDAGRWTAAAHAEQARYMATVETAMTETFVERCGGAPWMWRALIENETTITAYAALTRFGLIDQITDE